LLKQKEFDEALLDVSGLKRLLAMKTEELASIKVHPLSLLLFFFIPINKQRLAQKIVEQRGEVEQFFLDSLEFVKDQIYKQRAEEARVAKEAYKLQMKEV